MFLHKKYNAWIQNILKQLNAQIIRNEIQVCASAYYNKLDYVKQILGNKISYYSDDGQMEQIAAYLYLNDAINMRKLRGLVTTQYLTVLVVAANCTADDNQSRDQINFKNFISIITGFMGYRFDVKNAYIYGAVTPFEPVKTTQNFSDDFIKAGRIRLNQLYQSEDEMSANGLVDRAIEISNNLEQIASELLRNKHYARICADSCLDDNYYIMYSDYLKLGGQSSKNDSVKLRKDTSRKNRSKDISHKQSSSSYERYYSGCGGQSQPTYTSGCGQTGIQSAGYSSGCGRQSQPTYTSGCGQTGIQSAGYSSGCGSTTSYSQGC